MSYRHTVKPSVRAGETALSPLNIGLYQPGTHSLINLDRCLVQTESLNRLLDHIRLVAPKAGLQGYTPGDELDQKKQTLRYLVAREGCHWALEDQADEKAEIYLTLIVTMFDPIVIDRFIDELTLKNPEVSGIAVHVNRLKGNAIFDMDSPTEHRWGKSTLEWHWRAHPGADAITLEISAASFAQVNPFVAEAAYQEVIYGLSPQPNEVAIDLYCGTGSIGILLAAQARRNGVPLAKLYGFEESISSLKDARRNAERHKLQESEWVLGRVEEQLDALYFADQERDDRTLIVALNPSRRGCQSSVLDAVTRLRPRKIAYMSCHARTLARDLNRLHDHGYRMESITLFDMFPGSFHYETVSVLSIDETVKNVL